MCADGNDPEKRNILTVQQTDLRVVRPMSLSRQEEWNQVINEGADLDREHELTPEYQEGR